MKNALSSFIKFVAILTRRNRVGTFEYGFPGDFADLDAEQLQNVVHDVHELEEPSDQVIQHNQHGRIFENKALQIACGSYSAASN